ncbi:MAG TPA: hypothetical protein VKP65_04615, partial [Rhodothermales bacterium]|nr:hypothetical protein [Rhodothermales bacterium]
VLQMRLASLVQNRLTLAFEYLRRDAGRETRVAHGEQVVACMRRDGVHLVPTPIPVSLHHALQLYSPLAAPLHHAG